MYTLNVDFFLVLDGCKKTAIVFENVISGMEAVNCQSVQAQVREPEV